MDAGLPSILWVTTAALLGGGMALLLLGVRIAERSRFATVPRDLGLAILSGAIVTFGFTVVSVVVDDRRAGREAARAELVDLQETIRSNSDVRGIQAIGSGLDHMYAPDHNFTAANLSAASLSFSTLTNSDFTNVHAWGLDLAYSDARDSTFTGADLNGADMHGADLRGADFGGADLHGAVMTGADLRGTVMTNADMGAVAWSSDGLGPYACYDKTTVWPSQLPRPPMHCTDEQLARRR